MPKKLITIILSTILFIVNSGCEQQGYEKSNGEMDSVKPTISEVSPTQIETSFPADDNILTPTVEQTLPSSPNPEPSPTPGQESDPSDMTISITEIYADPCGGQWTDQFFEYIELFNYGDDDVNIDDLYLISSIYESEMQEIIPWSEHAPYLRLKPAYITDTSIIPSHSFALILSPGYWQGYKEMEKDKTKSYKPPFKIPDGTIILTVKDQYKLGNSTYGLVASEPKNLISGLALFVGSSGKIISTYGAPTENGSTMPKIIYADASNGFPMSIPDCMVAERIDPTWNDEPDRWMINNPSPGSGYYY